MHRQRLGSRITIQQGVGTQRLNSLTKEEGISNGSFQQRTKIRRSLCDDFFRNSIGGKEGTEPQEIRSCWIALFHSLEREGPGGGRRLGMIGHPRSPLVEYCLPMEFIDLPILLQAHSRCF